MAEITEGYREQLKNLWNNLNNRARLVIITAVILLILIFIIIIFRGNNLRYQPLFTNLNVQDAANIVNKLEEKNISYKLSGEGTTVMVPADDVYGIRLEMAAEGLPTQGVIGFEIFNNSQFGTTDFERKVNYYRAVSGELSRSICAMNGVDYARVQITAPKESLYVEEEVPASASVLLKLKPASQLNSDHVKSISNLVASSVQGLSAANVTIVDTEGNLLSPTVNKSGTDSRINMKQLTVQKEFEDELKEDLYKLLTKVLGPDNFTIQVRAELNFDQREVESKTYLPVVENRGIIRSQEKNEEIYEGKSAGAGGVPGTESNIPQYKEQESNSGSNNNYKKSNTVTNYEINEKIERHIYTSGEVEKISVSVMVDESVGIETVDKIKNSVKAAIAYDENRGDLVHVTTFNFDDTLAREVAEVSKVKEINEKRKMYIYGGLIAVTLLVIIIIIIILRKSVNKKYKPGEHADYLVGENIEKVKRDTERDRLTEEEKKKEKMKKELEDLVSNQPENIAQLLKNWLVEE